MSNLLMAFGGIAVIIIFVLLLVAAPAIFISVDNDSITADISNSSHNLTYLAGTEVAVGWMGFSELEIWVMIAFVLTLSFIIAVRR